MKKNLDDLFQILEQISIKLSEVLSGTDFLRRRMTSYIGSGVALTYLEDETPIYINSHDFGPSANYINGGVYEQDNLDVLLSFVKPDTIFLDIGANLGFFSIKVAQRCRRDGKVHAFEPHPELVRLFRASTFLNGLGELEGNNGTISIHQCGLGNENADVQFSYPIDHLAGGAIGTVELESKRNIVNARVNRLDDYMPRDFSFNLAKIDVEGHELDVIKGMVQILARSNDAKLLIEKLGTHRGYEDDIEMILRDLDFRLYSIGPNAILEKIVAGGLTNVDGYFLACREDISGVNLARQRFEIYPRQLNSVQDTLIEISSQNLKAQGTRGQILFYGPYWFLKRGVYKFEFIGELDGEIEISFASRFGHTCQKFKLENDRKVVTVIVENDLHFYECVGRVLNLSSSVNLQRISLHKVG